MTIIELRDPSAKPEFSEPPSPSSIQEFSNHELALSMKNIPQPLQTIDDESFEEIPIRCNKIVRFASAANIKDTLSRHDMSFMERCNYWIQSHEFLAIRRRNEKMNQAMNELDDLLAQISRREVAIDGNDPCANETGPQKKNTEFGMDTAIEEHLCGQRDIYNSEIFEDDPFADIYFYGDNDQSQAFETST